MKFDITIQSGLTGAEHAVEGPARVRTAASGRDEFKLDGDSQTVDWAEIEPGVYSFVAAGKSYVVSALPNLASPNGGYEVWVGLQVFQVQVRDSLAKRHAGPDGSREGPLEICAPMPGRIVRLLAQEGQAVAAGAGLLVIEAMKMQNEIRAPRAGTVLKLYVRDGDGVEAGARLISVA